MVAEDDAVRVAGPGPVHHRAAVGHAVHARVHRGTRNCEKQTVKNIFCMVKYFCVRSDDRDDIIFD